MPKMLIAATLLSAAALVALPAPTSAEPAAGGGHKQAEEMHKLGRQKIGTYTVSAIMVGDAEAGKTVKFDIKLIDAKADPKAMRVWIGAEDAKGSEKATATKKTATYGADVKVPSPLPAGAKAWVELETDAGIEKASYAFDDHAGHKH
jgi:hypothetical protein